MRIFEILFKLSKEKDNQTVNLLLLVPFHNIKWCLTEDGKVDLLTPKIKIEKIRRLFEKRNQSDYYKVHLDDIGSSVWKLINGQRTVETIAKEIHVKFGSEIEPIFERLGEFIRQLHQKKFISFKNYEL